MCILWMELFQVAISCIIWANCNYFNWNTHNLSQLQLPHANHIYCKPMVTISTKSRIGCAIHSYFKQKHAYSEPTTSETHIVWANCNCFKRTYIFWANCNDFKGITHTLSQVQLFQAKHHILRKRNYFKWNMHSLSQLQLFQVQHA